MLSHFIFFFKNYLRSHRYLRELVLIVLFNIFFYGFLYSSNTEDSIWTVFGVFCLLLTFVTVPSLFYLEKKNSLFFALIRPNGRMKLLISKIALIFVIDFFWLAVFAIIYGLRFLDSAYFLMLLPRLIFLGLLLLLSILIVTLSYTYKPWTVWILMLLIVFGSILNKIALFPVHSFQDSYKVISIILPPFLELIYSAVTLEFSLWRMIFLLIAVVQILIYFFVNFKLIQKKNFV